MKNVKILSKAFGLIMLNLLILAFAACDPQTIQLKPEETEVSYTVEHYLQKVSGDDYEIDAAATQELTGMSGAFTQAQAKTYEGFTPARLEQKILSANESIIIKIYYDRNIIEYTFDADGGKFFDEVPSIAISGRFGASLTAPDNPEKDDFDFTGWNESLPQTFGPEDKTFTATWTPKASQGGGSEAGNESGNESGEGQEEEKTVEYTVVYYTQNKYDDDYSRYDSDTMTGKVGEKTKALAPDLEGFTVNSIEEKTIAEDGSTVVEIKYDRKIIKYTFNAGDGSFADGSNKLVLSGRYEASVPTQERPSRSGYDFEGWDSKVPYEFGEEELTFNACWKFGADTPYKIIYWEQNISDNNYTKVNEYSMKAPAGEEVTDEPSTKDGFTAKPVTPVTVKADGSSVLNVYYDRNLITYTFDADGGNWNGSTDNLLVKGRYGADVTVPANPVKAGYEFFDWDLDIPQKFGDKDITFKAWWSAKSGIPYTVKYWKQNIADDDYTIDIEDSNNYGIAGQKTNAYASASFFGDGFTLKAFEQQVIAGDGSTVVNIYYDRKIINYKFTLNGGTWQNGSAEDLVVSGKFGASVSVPADPIYDYEDEYYDFEGWLLGNAVATPYLSTFDSNTRIFTPKWVHNQRQYTVKHLKQNVNNDNYTEAESETKSGYPREQTAAVAKTYAGFTVQTVAQSAIAVDGSTVINIYYKRNNIVYTFQLNGGSLSSSSTVTKRFGIPVEKPADPVNIKTQYGFRNWYTNSSFETPYDFNSTPSEDTTIYAGWNYLGEQAKAGISIVTTTGTTTFANTEEVYVIDPAKTGNDITVITGTNEDGVFINNRTVKLSPFIMGKYEVTQELYTAVMTEQKVTVGGIDTLETSPFKCKENENYPLAEGENQSLRPAENMTWYDAVYFCNKLTELIDGNTNNQAYVISNILLTDDGKHIKKATVTLNLQKSGYRLPTEAEWEYAARGGNPSDEINWAYKYSGSNTLSEVGWANLSTGTHQVGKKNANYLGIYDMSGNVEEWCYDWQQIIDTGTCENPVGGDSLFKMKRGGRFFSSDSGCTNSNRGTQWDEPYKNSVYRGFRLVRSVIQ